MSVRLTRANFQPRSKSLLRWVAWGWTPWGAPAAGARAPISAQAKTNDSTDRPRPLMTLSSRRTKTFESKRQRLKACCPWPAALKPDVAGIVGRHDAVAHARGSERQPRARTLARERRRQDPGEPRRALRGEELR